MIIKPNIISHIVPDIYFQLKERFGVNWDDIIIAYYPHIHIAKGNIITESKYIHELTHIHQQSKFKGGAKDWFAQYIQDKKFRLTQELEAYKNEIMFINQNIKDRNERYRLIRKIIIDLSSPMYDLGINYEQSKLLLT